MGEEVRFQMVEEEGLELLKKAMAVVEVVVEAGLQKMLEDLVPALAWSVREAEGEQRLKAVGLAVVAVAAQKMVSARSGFLEEEGARVDHWKG